MFYDNEPLGLFPRTLCFILREPGAPGISDKSGHESLEGDLAFGLHFPDPVCNKIYIVYSKCYAKMSSSQNQENQAFKKSFLNADSFLCFPTQEETLTSITLSKVVTACAQIRDRLAHMID